jgi:Ser/Thr protein kinase RdoA (MazF antagonist)
MVSSNLVSVGYSTATAKAIADLVVDRFEIRGLTTCTLLNRGFNDTYLVRTAAGERFVLRVSGRRTRGPADVEAETAFLAYLESSGVPVAAPLPTRDGRLFTMAYLPEGNRPVVLFKYVGGRLPNLDAPEDARVQGKALARVHQAADHFPAWESGGRRLDLDQLLHRQVAAVLELELDAPQARSDLLSLAARLADSVGNVDQMLTRTHCHGDCHGLNARIATSGPSTGQAILFDFDDGGHGYVAYDLAVHLWAQVSFGRRRHAMWHAFDEGYRSVRSVTPADEAAVPIFVAIRHIWLMGEYATKVDEWGSENLPSAWLRNHVAFLLAWEGDKLLPALL